MPSAGLKSPARAVAAAAASFAIVVLVWLAQGAYDSYQRAIARADREAQNVRILLAESTAHTFDVVSRALATAVELRRETEAVWGPAIGKTSVHEVLRGIVGSSPVVRRLGWTDAHGNLLYSSEFRDPPSFNVADQEQFTVHANRSVGGPHIASPTRSVVDGSWIIGVSRRYDNAQGEFAGIVYAIVAMDYFTNYYQSLDIGGDGRVALLRADGTLLARDPDEPSIRGASFALTSLFREHLPRDPAGTYRGHGAFDGSDRIVSYGTVPGFPLVVTASISMADALAGFYRQLARTAPLAVLVIVATGLGAWLLVVLIRRREQLAEAAAEKTSLLESVFASIDQAVAVFDRDRRLVAWNDKLPALFRLPSTMIAKGAPLDELVRAVSDGGEYEGEDPAQAVTDRLQYAASGERMRYERRRRDGTVIAVDWVPMPDGFLAITHTDITELKRREIELAAAKEAADKANGAKSEFLSRMSHELRTPLNAVIGFAQMLELNRPNNLNPSQLEYCRHINHSGHHLLALVNEVLDLARIESGDLKLSIERVAVADVVDSVKSTMMPLAAKAGIALDVADAAGVPDVRADDLRLRQVLINLVSNAIKYNRTGGSVTLSAAAIEPGLVRFFVRDTGVGIPKDRESELFQPFKRLGAEYTAIEGAGIGLSISRRLAEAMQGVLDYATEPGQGSSFWVDLPVETAEPDAAWLAGKADHPAVARAMAGGYSLLYFEDNLTNLRLMEQLISTIPDVVMLSAITPRLGLDLAVAHRPNVIVVDVNLPEMNGYEVLARLKAMPETCHIPVIALTAAAMPLDVKRGQAAGFFRYLTKPIDVKVFLAAVDAALSASDKRRVNGG
ncbi:MAG: PAS-domain containing protein [Alphaproteobacteria bacterium]|nr:PAS-domain containing protein [Alphaproteobacteria bacterium]